MNKLTDFVVKVNVFINMISLLLKLLFYKIAESIFYISNIGEK